MGVGTKDLHVVQSVDRLRSVHQSFSSPALNNLAGMLSTPADFSLISALTAASSCFCGQYC